MNIRRNTIRFRSALSAIFVSATVAALTASGSSAQQRIGFIPNNVQMKETDSLTHEWTAPSFNHKQFTEVVILPVTTPADGAYGDLTDEQLAELRTTFTNKLNEAFKVGMGAAAGAPARKLVIHAAITAIKPNKPLLNVAPQTQILRRGYGFASCEMFATDGDIGSVVAAYMQTVDTQRLGTAKYSSTGTASKAAEDWSSEFFKLVTK